MLKTKSLAILVFCFSTFTSIGQIHLKNNGYKLTLGEIIHYKAKLGYLTIGSATSKIDSRLYKIGNNICYKVDLNGASNGLAKVFFLKDRWQSYITVSNFSTIKSLRSIQEGKYHLEEIVDYFPKNKNAFIRQFYPAKNRYQLKKSVETTPNIRDVVAAFMLMRCINFTKYTKNDTLVVNGLNGTKLFTMKILVSGKEFININSAKKLCYKLQPIVANNHVFDGLDAINIWIATDKSQKIVKASAKLVFGELTLEPE